MQATWAELLQEESRSGRVAALLCQWQREAVRRRGEQVVHQHEVCPQHEQSFHTLTIISTSLVRQCLHSPNPHVAPRRRKLQWWWSHTSLQCRRRRLSNREPLRRRQPHRQPLWRLYILRWCFRRWRREPHPSLEPHRHVLLLHPRPFLLPNPRSRTLLRAHPCSILPYPPRLETLRCAYAGQRFHDGADAGGTPE